MFIKIVILFLLLIILISLGWGFYYLSRDQGQGQSKRTLRALIVRIAITTLLAMLIVVGIFTGFVTPHPLG